MLFRRAVVAVVVGLGVIALSASSALAFECYNANRSERGNAAAATSRALMSLEEILSDPEIVGLCPAGVAHVLDATEDAGFRTDVLINFHALMAGGLEETDRAHKLHDGRGIDHLGEEFFEFVDPVIGEAFGICFGG